MVGVVLGQRPGLFMRRWPTCLALALYSALLRLLMPVYLLRLWWRGHAEPLYRHTLGERLGIYNSEPSKDWVWVHAVSLGETLAAAALVRALRSRLPDAKLLLTHSTATGRHAGRSLLQAGDRQVWLPYDAPGSVQRFLRQFRPAVGVLIETETWPNLLLAARTAKVPMVLANARLSDHSRKLGRRLDALLRPAIESMALVLAQTEGDARRLRDSGAQRVEVCGNLKFDITPDAALLAQGRQWRDAVARPVVLATSTREGEEAELLDAWKKQAEPRPLLLIVPRHPQRFDEVAALVQSAGISLARRSRWGAQPPQEAWQAQVWLGDSMGEMPLYYALAQVALLGGSFAPLGGQNLIEAAACGCPLLMGPNTFNFSAAAELSLVAGAAQRVQTMQQAVATACAMLSSPAQAEQVAKCLAFAAQHRGAADKIAARIEGILVGVNTPDLSLAKAPRSNP